MDVIFINRAVDGPEEAAFGGKALIPSRDGDWECKVDTRV